MAKLTISINNPYLREIYLCGKFCDWNVDKMIAVKKTKNKFIANDMPKGEYKVFSCDKTFLSVETTKSGNDISNRYFSGNNDETIKVFFK